MTGIGRLDVLFVTPWLLEALLARKLPIEASKVVIYHHKVNEDVPTCVQCVAPKQGEIFPIAP